jgi:hypothetical protein
MSIPVSTARLSVILLAGDDPTGLLECLAAQTLSRDRFEVLVVTAPSAGSDVLAWAAAHPDLPVRLVDAEGPTSAGRNAGLDAATGTHLTFVDSRDRIGPRMLECLLGGAGGDAVTITATARLDRPDGTATFDTPDVAALMPFVGRPATRTDLVVALGSLGGKLVPTALARAVRFREDITARPELVFWAEVLAAGAGLRLAALAADGAYLERPRGAVTAIETTIRTIAALQDLDLADSAALKARTVAVERLIADEVRPYLEANPGELRRVRAELRAAGIADKRAPLERHAAEELVFLGAAPAHDDSGSLLATRLAGHAIDLAIYQPDGAPSSIQALREPAADVIDQLITSYGPLHPTWAEIGTVLTRVQREIEHQEGAKARSYRWLRSLGAAPIEHLGAAVTKLARTHLEWTAEIPLADPDSVVAGAQTAVEGDAWFQVLGAGLVEAGYAVEEVPEQLPLFTEMVTLGLADRLVFDTRDQAERVLARCPVPEIAARARGIVTLAGEPDLPGTLFSPDLQEVGA